MQKKKNSERIACRPPLLPSISLPNHYTLTNNDAIPHIETRLLDTSLTLYRPKAKWITYGRPRTDNFGARCVSEFRIVWAYTVYYVTRPARRGTVRALPNLVVICFVLFIVCV